MGYGSPCGSTFCGTSDDPEYSAVAIDDDGNVWGADSAAQWDGNENVRRLAPASGAPTVVEYVVSAKVGKLAWAGNSLYGTVPGQSVLRQIIPGAAPNVTEIDYGVSGVVGTGSPTRYGAYNVQVWLTGVSASATAVADPSSQTR